MCVNYFINDLKKALFNNYSYEANKDIKFLFYKRKLCKSFQLKLDNTICNLNFKYSSLS